MKHIAALAIIALLGCSRPTEVRPIRFHVDSRGWLSCYGCLLSRSKALHVVSNRMERVGTASAVIDITSDSSWEHVDTWIRALHSAGVTNISLVYLDDVTSVEHTSKYSDELND